MTTNEEVIKSLISCSIIVWNGTTTQYHFVKGLIQETDMVRLADEEEIEIYKQARDGK